MSDARPGTAGGGARVAAFLVAVRRRGVVAALLAGCATAAAVNEAVRWSAVGVNVWAHERLLPVLDVGPLLLPALAALLWRRRGLPWAARRADARLAFHDRLASFVDFAGRGDVPREVRDAQAAETARALAPASPRAVAPLRPWLAAGPALLVASLMYPLLVPTMEQPPAARLVHRLVSRAPQAPAEHEEEGGAGAPGDREGDDAPRAGGPPGDDAGAPATDPGAEAPPADQRGQPATSLAEGGPGAARERAARGRPSRSEPGAKEPASLVSERVGTKLAGVVDPVLSSGAGGAQPAPAPTGSFAFHLLPKGRGEGGAAGVAGEAPAPERVTVDFDALPEQYRPLVRTYFELLAQRAAAPAGDNPAHGKEPTR